ncbi:MAG: Malonyl CoA-acyl carrier protein transacylase [Actinobacteria bacterium]|nr:Malonyl CoA-acyl carrier protein transacylase [Actinomycetota bacterium]
MARMAFVFPGQGSQKIGMGLEMLVHYPDLQYYWKEASRILEFDLQQLCSEGPLDLLNQTRYAQPAILTASVVCARAAEKEGLRPYLVLGHSLGEYSALVVSGALSFEEAIGVVKRRGELMEDANCSSPGAMAAIMGLEENVIEEICGEISGQVYPANYNSPDQIVVSGEIAAVDAFIVEAKRRKARRAIKLNVGVASHCPLMKEVALGLEKVLKQVNFRQFEIPFLSTVSLTEPVISDIGEILREQLVSPIRWAQAVRIARGRGINSFVEIGPSKVLSGLIRKIDPEAAVFNIEDYSGLLETIHKLEVN